MVAPASQCLPIPSPDPAYLALTVSAMTAAVALGEVARPKEGEVALVTAAGGGTGSFAVQLLKRKYGCKVVGTCSSEEKGEYLLSIGCDEYINYKVSREELAARMTEVAPDGFHVIYECVGGVLRDVAVEHIAIHGRMVIIGGISGYTSGDAWQSTETDYFFANGLRLLVRRSAAVSGFLLPYYWDVIPTYFEDIKKRFEEGSVTVRLDPHRLTGLEKVAEAVAYLYTGKSYGKVILNISDE
ncbi:oxidoreductase [Angomonas deanei]|uniref:Zinc-binding dehydrogenase, putative n=1 Tax=Angomonas deanei TaxID=59799 RepID=S9VJU7_9TRYP|nr:NADPH2:quinone reductase [Angomonas deanei]EPY41099.1 oxidoreductase [Angomonas deanei]CAD2215658.1 Zinc-binding dehydrogenase, putative [Angomonas deanei]|eukprot:EPY28754.1 NADPH2:quinone reductase [Angomonas deanei]